MHGSKYKKTNSIGNKCQQNRINGFNTKRMHIEFGFQKQDADNIVN